MSHQKKLRKWLTNFHWAWTKEKTGETVPQPGPSTSRLDIELSLSDADSGFVEQPDDISHNEQQVVPGTDLSTSVSIVDLNGVHHGATTSTDGTDLNVPDLSASESSVDLNGVDDGGTTSMDRTGLIVHNEINMKGNQRDSILEDESDINCPDRSKENSVRDDKRIGPIKIKTTITDANSVTGE